MHAPKKGGDLSEASTDNQVRAVFQRAAAEDCSQNQGRVREVGPSLDWISGKWISINKLLMVAVQ